MLSGQDSPDGVAVYIKVTTKPAVNRHIQYILALMCAESSKYLNGSLVDIQENAVTPFFSGPPRMVNAKRYL